MGIIIGTAPDSWGVWFPSDPKQTPATRFLDEVAEVGYEYIELGPYGYLPSKAADLRRELESRNLKVCAATAIARLSDPSAWKSLEAQVLGGGELAGELGGKYLVLIDGSYKDAFTAERVRVREDAESGRQPHLRGAV
jgi:inosose dehydratase